jgi:hypothetical protein
VTVDNGEHPSDQVRARAVEDLETIAARERMLASVGLTDYSQVDKLSVQYKSVNIGAKTSPGSPGLTRLVSPKRPRQ